jgi:hypothetical protein
MHIRVSLEFYHKDVFFYFLPYGAPHALLSSGAQPKIQKRATFLVCCAGFVGQKSRKKTTLFA